MDETATVTVLAIPADTPSGYGFAYRSSDGDAGRMHCAWPLFCAFLGLHYADRAQLVCAGVTSSFSLKREANFAANSGSRDGCSTAMPTRDHHGDR